jgi:hypothetical protein
MVMPIDGEAIIDARVRGESVHAIARRFGCSIDDVNDTLDFWARSVIHHRVRLHSFALEIERLDTILKAFDPLMRGGSAGAAMVVMKAGEQRRLLLSLSAGPARPDAQMIDAQAEPPKTSTDRIREVVERLCLEGPTPKLEPQ